MILTEYTRQVPIKHWLPTLKDDSGIYLDGDCPQLVITGYKQQRAWFTQDLLPFIEANDREKLMLGQEVEGFEWRDEPIIGG